MGKRVTLKMLSIISIPLGLVLLGFGAWCVYAFMMLKHSEIDESMKMIWLTAVIELVRYFGDIFMDFMFTSIGMLCAVCGVENLICSALGLITVKQGTERAYRRFIWICRIMCLPAIIAVIWAIVRSLAGGAFTLSALFAGVIGVRLICIPQTMFIRTADEEQKNAASAE